MKLALWIFFILTFIGPLAMIISGKIEFNADYSTANRDSAELASNPTTTPDAIIQVYSARAFNWRGIFAMHTWMAIKPKDAQAYTIYQVVGWRLWRNLSPVVEMQDLPDRNWFDQPPKIILDIRGDAAEKIIPALLKSVADYPYSNEYITYPGPNSNTFIAYLGRQNPGLQLAMPSNALGKDYLPDSRIFAKAISGTGYQFSVYGIFGITIARIEGLEINILGLVYGFSPATLTLKLPGFGDIKF